MLRRVIVLLALLPQAPAAMAGSVEELASIQQRVCEDPAAALEEAQQELTEARGRNDAPAQLRALRVIAWSAIRLDDTLQSAQAAREGSALAARLRDPVARSHLLVAEAQAATSAQRYGEATALLDEAQRLAEGQPHSVAIVHLRRGMFAYQAGRDAEALESLRLSHALAQTASDPFTQADALMSMGHLSTDPSASDAQFERGIAQHQEALALAEKVGCQAYKLRAMSSIGYALAARQRFDAARPYLESTVSLGTRLKHWVEQTLAIAALAGADISEGHYDAALRRLDTAKPLPGSIYVARVWSIRAKALAHKGDRGGALAALKAQEAALASHDSLPQRVLFLRRAAEVRALLGDMKEAYQLMEALRKADREQARAANERQLAQERARFDLQRKEHENATLKARERESEARRLALWLALACSALVAAVLVLALRLQVVQKRRMTQLAWFDELTGVPNRRRMLDIARGCLANRRAEATEVHIALLDIDHFKQVNDRHGHDVGDEVLKAFAACCRQTLRDGDAFGRFGGEEFLLVLSPCDAATVPIVFGRLRAAVSALRWSGHPSLSITFSMGVTAAAGGTLEETIKRADLALYDAKHRGRDRYVLAPHKPSEADGVCAQADEALA